MKLEDFVATSLVEVVKGVAKAIDDTKECKGAVAINPRGNNQQRSDVQLVDFDIAVSVKEDKTKDGGGEIKVMALSIGAKAGSATAQELISRVRFSVPISWPSTAVDLYKRYPASQTQRVDNEYDPYKT